MIQLSQRVKQLEQARGWQWLQSTRKLQEESFAVDYDNMVGDDLADYLTMNATALNAEVFEFLGEVGWKSWVKNRGWVNHEAALKEAVDIGHFLANLLCAIGVTDDEWIDAYTAKQQLNRNRMANGYDGVSDKCAVCKRALDDMGTELGNAQCLCSKR